MPGPTRNVGAKVVLDGEKEYKQALSELSAGNKTLASEMRKLQAEYKGNTESTEYLTKAGDLLERKLLQQQDKVEKLREAVSFAALIIGMVGVPGLILLYLDWRFRWGWWFESR